MEIKDYKSGDEKQILDLFQIVFKKEMSIEYWTWRFQNNPVEDHMIKLMWDKDSLVGHYAVSPIVLRKGVIKEKAALSMTTMTHPNYGGKGIFKDLANSLYNKLKMDYNYSLVMGFPNSNSHYGFIKNLQWINLGLLTHIFKNVECIIPRTSPFIQLVDRFTTIHSTLLERITNDFLSVYKDVEYLNWRYVENPDVQYFIFEYDEGCSLKGFLVVKLYPTGYDGKYNIFIVENGIPKEHIDLLPEFLSHVVHYFSPHLEMIYTWLPLFDERYIFYEKNGFIPGGKPTYLGVRALKNNKFPVDDIRTWYYSYGDSDIY